MHPEYILRWINNCWTGSKVGKFIGTISFQTIQIEWCHSNIYIYVPSMVHSFRSSSPWIEWLSCQNNFGLRANSTFPCLKYVEHWGGTGIPNSMLNLIVSLKVMSKALYDWLHAFCLCLVISLPIIPSLSRSRPCVFILHFTRLDVDFTQTSMKYCSAFITQISLCGSQKKP